METVLLVLITSMMTSIKQLASKTLVKNIDSFKSMVNVAHVKFFPAKIYQILKGVSTILTYASLTKN